MTAKLEMYRCEICGNLVQVIVAGGGELYCCGAPMKLVSANNGAESLFEKHIPVFTRHSDNGLEIKVGQVLHPMNDDHHIMFIETISEDKDHVKLEYLHPGHEAKIMLKEKLGRTLARAFCNLHGLFEGECD